MDKQNQLSGILQISTEYNSLADNIAEGLLPQAIFGVEYGSFILNILTLYSDYKKLVVMVENEAIGRRLQDDLSSHVAKVHLLDKLEIIFFDAYSHSHQTENARLAFLYHLLEDDDGLFIMPVDSTFLPLNQSAYYLNERLALRVGDEISRDQLLNKLVAYGYAAEEVVEATGQFAVRGGIVDILPPLYQSPLRIEFFGDEVDSLRLYDITSLRSIENVEQVVIRPCREGLLFGDQIDAALELIERRRSATKSDVQNQLLDKLTDDLKEGLHADSRYQILPLYLSQSSTIFDYIGDTLTLYWHFNRIVERNRSRYADWTERFKYHLEKGDVLAEQIRLMIEPDEWLAAVDKAKSLIFSGLKTPLQRLKLKSIIDYHFREAPVYHRQYDLAKADIGRWLSNGYAVYIVLNDDAKLKGVGELLEEGGLASQIVQTAEGGPGIHFVKGDFPNGFSTATFKVAVLTESELFGKRRAPKRRRVKHAKSIKSFTDLSSGDYVVHDTHGIGKYLGVFQLTVDGKKKDFLKISYKADDVLYVPVERMETLQKYIGADVAKVRLSKLGGTEWIKTKQRVKKSVEDMTDELIALYAERRARKGFAFSADGDWQRQFELAFPYRETEDQLKCIEEIKRDMESAKPMERLLCGDVGYGKTEVAMRAIFKAVTDSKQAAILVPTTILAQQHYDTLMHRFSSFPVTVAVLSRFRTKQQIERALDDIRSGVVDIVVGTHRLLSNDVKFKDLGLLVVDEEQRFGVKHKEKIKSLKSNIDVLTLSATPIPRTLHMSLTGIRDLSTIEDPPEERYPIQTYVLSYQPTAIREAILREIDRRGQVYFVHNRVYDIDRVTAQLRNLVPEARIEYAHGKMKDTELEAKMYAFMNGEFDVLVSTTIVESGLDIGNVNTMIVNQADRFGLSQLYQLRGRVGRSNRLAYAYLTYQRDKVLTEIAEKRLKAIKEFTDLGSGFKIAMRDLELRGAGTLLGAEQHGHMTAVGYELYTKLLEEAVITAKGGTVAAPIDSEIEISCEAYIPEYYIKNAKFKIDVYKRISAIRHSDDKYQIQDDLIDLYGDIPKSVLNLIDIGYLRAMASKHQFVKVGVEKGVLSFVYAESAQINPLLISVVLSEYNGKGLEFKASQPIQFQYKMAKKKRLDGDVLSAATEIIEAIDRATEQIDNEE